MPQQKLVGLNLIEELLIVDPHRYEQVQNYFDNMGLLHLSPLLQKKKTFGVSYHNPNFWQKDLLHLTFQIPCIYDCFSPNRCL